MEEKPKHVTKLKAFSKTEEADLKEALGRERDAQQAILIEARSLRTDLLLKNRDKYINFMQKIGELSLTFGAAMIPLIIATNAQKDIKTAYALVGAAVYLSNGVVALWLTKSRIEQDVDDTPFIGLNEEIMTYPLIYAKNKLILEPNNVQHVNEHIDAEWDIIHQPLTVVKQKKPSIWADTLIFNFVVASTLIAGTLWPYQIGWYWLTFIIIVLLMLILIGLDYRRSINNQNNLQQKHKTLFDIKDTFGKWRNKKMSGK